MTWLENEKYYSIGEFSKRIGVAPSTLRLWEQKGVLIPHHRTTGGKIKGKRVYTETQAVDYLSGKRDVNITFENGVLNDEALQSLTSDEKEQLISALSKEE